MKTLPFLLVFGFIAPGALAVEFYVSDGRRTPVRNEMVDFDREYGTGHAAAVVYAVGIKAKDLDDATGSVVRLMKEAGADGPPSRPFPAGVRTLSFMLPTDQAEAAAKRLLKVGELQSYSRSRQNPEDVPEHLGPKIKALEGELADEEAMRKLPIARYFLTKKLESFKRSKDSFEASYRRSEIRVSIIPAHFRD